MGSPSGAFAINPLKFGNAESLRWEWKMKRIFFGISLGCAVLLLSACPDSKMPNPSPKVPEPKLQSTTKISSKMIYARGNLHAELPRMAAYTA